MSTLITIKKDLLHSVSRDRRVSPNLKIGFVTSGQVIYVLSEFRSTEVLRRAFHFDEYFEPTNEVVVLGDHVLRIILCQMERVEKKPDAIRGKTAASSRREERKPA